MRLWRLTKAAHIALDGAGAAQHGSRYSDAGRPVVHFASEAGLAVLIALRYLPRSGGSGWGYAPAGDAPVGVAPTGDASVGDATANDASAKDASAKDDYVLGYCDSLAVPLRVPDDLDEADIRAGAAAWLDGEQSLLAAVRSKVLPEGDVVMLNPLHPDAANLPALTTRKFDFAECLHRPPMLEKYTEEPL